METLSSSERRLRPRRRDDAGNGAAKNLLELKFREAKAEVIARFEREYLCALLTRTEGNVSRAARIAGKERSRFKRLVRKHELQPREFKPAAIDA
jgi:DNA-binding NtrC family response regulator